jgi:hypothetical protein
MDSDCDDQNPCTDDDCTVALACAHTNNADSCATDNNPCTDDVCDGGQCAHPSNMTCECSVPGDCDALEDDPMNCTFNRCTPAGDCDFVVNDSCEVGNAFVVNSFNSSGDWAANVCTPSGLPLVDTGMNNPNLEANATLYFADNDGASLVMDVAAQSMVGLDRLAIVIQSGAADTAAMVSVGVFDGSAWHDVVLSSYGEISQGQYGTIEIPLLDFDIPLGTIGKVRLVTTPTGGQKVWRIDQIEVRDN